MQVSLIPTQAVELQLRKQFKLEFVVSVHYLWVISLSLSK